MRSSAVAVEIVRLWAPDNLRRVAPGVALCAVIAAIAFTADKQNFLRFGAVWIPPLILTLVIGMALQPLSDRAVLKPGIEFAGRTLLRVGVALYGARLTFGQLVDGGALPVLIALAAVSCTIVFGAWAARLFGLDAGLRPADRLRHRRVRCCGSDGGLGGAAQARQFRPRPRLHGDGRELPRDRGDGDLSHPAAGAGLLAARDGRVPGRRHP